MSIVSQPTALISPEDFEHSTATPQKAMELRQRLLPPDAIKPSNPAPMNKQQFSETLVNLLQVCGLWANLHKVEW